MAEQEAQALTYIPEVILKKRKSNEEWALKRKAQYEERQSIIKKRAKQDFIRMPEDFIKQYRTRELDLIKMKQRVKRKRTDIAVNSKLLFVLRINGKKEMHPRTKKLLYNLRLRSIFSGVFVIANEWIIEKLKKVEPYVTYGYPNLKNVRELIYKKGFLKKDKQRVPLTDNNIIEQALGQYDIICIEDIVHEIATVGPHFKEVTSFLWPFSLNKPEDGLQGTKTVYKQGGDAGNRDDHINELLSKMN